MHNWYDEILQVLDDDERQVIKETDILTWFQNNEERYDNIRLLKNKMEQAIYEKLATTFAIEKKGEERRYLIIIKVKCFILLHAL